MSTIIKFEKFDASTVPLESSNLIEASAGTGKTYSIAILLLRLLLEKKFSIKEILMVTFTKAAVAELEERIRLFIRLAYQVSKEEKIEDTTISTIVNNAIERDGREIVSQLLRDAVIFLDETSVLTIHSFCQQTLTEFAFETNQLFGAELLQDTAQIIEAAVNRFWRKHITSIPTPLLGSVINNLSRGNIVDIVKNHLDGKRYNAYNAAEKIDLDEAYYLNILTAIENYTIQYDEERAALIKKITETNASLKTTCNANTIAKKNMLHLVDEPEAFLGYLVAKRGSAYIIKLFADLLDLWDKCEAIKIEKEAASGKFIDTIYYAAITEVGAEVKKYKLQNNLVSFDDLILNLHTALVKKENPVLIAALQKKYKAVFIDEFQDTDRLQYEIFKKAFATNTVLFYIGDPKQSIYAWRKADIATYFKAYDDVDVRYEMNENYRSSEAYIKAMNLFFQPTADFDTFHYPAAAQAITYIPVNSPTINTKGKLLLNDVDCTPISINYQPNKPSIEYAVAAQIVDLLSNKKYSISKNGIHRNIKPSDIGILVRKNKEGNIIKKILAKYGLPAITIGDAKVLESDEAISILYILEAMIDISKSNINRALLASFTGFNTKQILALKEETAIELFKKYKINWDTDGIYSALMNFMADFGIQQIVLQNNFENGERTITNLYQLVELLYKIQTTKKLSALELIGWLKRSIERNDVQGDEYEQRIENDEECIKIVTIHKSKGLEYNIVLAPFLDIAEYKTATFCSFRSDDGTYINFKKEQLTDDQLAEFRQQTEQENRRILYVALTRAVYKCFVYKSTDGKLKNSTLGFFTSAVTLTNNILIEEIISADIPEKYHYKPIIVNKPDITANKINFSLQQENWQRMSYTMLAAEVDKPAKKNTVLPQDEYDHFIFRQLIKGSQTGNMLHYILENLHFTNNEQWKTVLETAIKRFAPAQKDIYLLPLENMLTHILNAPILIDDVSFNLAEVNFENRIHEFEFDFPVKTFQAAELQTLTDKNLLINVKERYNLEGIMNGKIDMLFKCKGKYFILDWKSTYLGDTLEPYTPAALQDAMNENNYHLQYLIYTLATKKYLESRLPDFNYERDFGGVLYLFIRGMRAGTNYGIFNCKPTIGQVEILENLFNTVVDEEILEY